MLLGDTTASEIAGIRVEESGQSLPETIDVGIVVGGDGTMHELINGMMTRTDGRKLPIGLITGGTGNSFMHDMDCLDPVNAAKRIVTDRRRSIDIFRCEADGTIYYGFNIVGWGIPTDANNLAEKLRWMG